MGRDRASLLGERFELAPDELEVLRTGRVLAEVSDLQDPEHVEDAHFGRLLQVYLGVRTPTGQSLLFEPTSRTTRSPRPAAGSG